MRPSGQLNDRSRGSAGLRALVAMGCAVAVFGAARTALAARGEHEVHGAVAAGYGGTTLLGADARWLYNITDFWALGGGLQDRRLGAWGKGDTAAMAEARLVVDALTWVPAASVGVGPAWISDARSAEAWTGVARAEAQLGWRPTRRWAVWLRVGGERRLQRSASTRMWASLGASWIASPFDALEL